MFLTNLADILTQANLPIIETPLWRTRTRSSQPSGFPSQPKLVMLHHTGTPASSPGNYPSHNIVTKGRSDLPGPLSQLGLGRDGTWYIVAAGTANHAGVGEWQGVTSGNSYGIGIEAEHPGGQVPWTSQQYDSYVKGVAALIQAYNIPTRMVCAHKEYAPKRKVDPNFDMTVFRQNVVNSLTSTPLNPPSPTTPTTPTQPSPFPILKLGANDQGNRSGFVHRLQARLNQTIRAGLKDDGDFGNKTRLAVLKFQKTYNLTQDSIVGSATWAKIESLAKAKGFK